jgi:hypothetical protein
VSNAEINRLNSALRSHINGREQFDDITLPAVRRQP